MKNILKTKLIGEQLSSVEFIQDYLQLHFDGRNFIIYVWPHVYLDGKKYSFGEDHYRNVLCKLIGLNIRDIILKDNEFLKLIFDNEKEGIIEINLNNNSPNLISEIAIFNDTLDGSWSVFE